MVASGSRTMIACSLFSLYEGFACQEIFSCSIFLPFQERLTRAQFCIDGTAVPLAWPR
jgi:hypothetical protein